MKFIRGLGSFYWRIGQTYVSKAGSLLLLAAIVFVPVGFLDAFTTGIDIETLDPGSLIKLAATIGAVAAITMTGLLGEVFYSGAVAVSLTHPANEKPPSIGSKSPAARLPPPDPGRHRLRRPRDRRPGRLLHPRHPRLRLVRPGRAGGRAGGTGSVRRPAPQRLPGPPQLLAGLLRPRPGRAPRRLLRRVRRPPRARRPRRLLFRHLAGGVGVEHRLHPRLRDRGGVADHRADRRQGRERRGVSPG